VQACVVKADGTVARPHASGGRLNTTLPPAAVIQHNRLGGVAYRPHFDGLVDMIPAYLGHMHHVPGASTTVVASSMCVLALIL